MTCLAYRIRNSCVYDVDREVKCNEYFTDTDCTASCDITYCMSL